MASLRPNVGDGEDLRTALKRIADVGRRTTAVPIELIVDELPRFGGGVEREIIGIAQEALTNASATHAPGASQSAPRPCNRSACACRSRTMAAGLPRSAFAAGLA